MGQAKHDLDRQEEKRVVAEEILRKAGIIKPCKYHEDTLLQMEDDLQGAYKLANYLTSQKDGLVSEFKGNREDLANTIRDVYNDCGEECYSCEKWARE